MLTAPQKWFKYNARNISGDAEAVFVGNPSAFKKVPQAIKELYEVMFKDRPMSKDMREFFERGLFQTVLQAVEVGDLDQLKMFQHLYEKEQRYKKHGKLLAAPTKAWQTYWKYARLTTDFREAILRYAACLDYLEQMKDDPKGKPKSFGASKPENVMAMDNIYDRAFKLANELCGAYNRVGVIGQFLRENLIPFWSWNEVNFRRYIQLWRNMWNDGKFTEAVGRKTASKVAGLVIKSPVIAFRIGKITLATFAWTGLMMAWNNLLFGDEEDDLPKDVQLKPHLIFGRDKDGKVKYIDRLGMLDDFLEWFGLDEAGVYVYEFMNGRRSFKETVRDMVVAPFNKLAQGITPLIKLPFELITGASLYPDIKQPGHIYDKPEYFARQFGLADEYKAMRGKSRQPYGNTLQKWLILKADPGESAYYEIKDLKRDYMKEVLEKGSGAGYYDNSRSEALYNVKMALRYNDTKAFEKYLQEYVLLGGTSKGLNQSLRSLDPFYGLKGDEGKEFYDSLTPQEQVKAKRAMEFYRDVLLRTDDKKFDESAKKAVDRALKKLDEDY